MKTPTGHRKYIFAAAMFITATIATACGESTPTRQQQLPTLCSEPSPNFKRLEYDTLKNMQIPQELQQQYPGLFDNGSLKSWEVLSTGKSYEVQLNMTGITELLDAADGDAHTGINIRDDYWNNRNRVCG